MTAFAIAGIIIAAVHCVSALATAKSINATSHSKNATEVQGDRELIFCKYFDLQFVLKDHVIYVLSMRHRFLSTWASHVVISSRDKRRELKAARKKKRDWATKHGVPLIQ